MRGERSTWRSALTTLLPALFTKGWGRVVGVLAALAILGGLVSESMPMLEARSTAPDAVPSTEILVSALPPEARQTLKLIQEGGPFPYEKDGTVFGNREGKLPRQKRGYYTEYTVRTPGVSHRGARRIVAGGPRERLIEFYYTDDHYQSFRKIRMP